MALGYLAFPTKHTSKTDIYMGLSNSLFHVSPQFPIRVAYMDLNQNVLHFRESQCLHNWSKFAHYLRSGVYSNSSSTVFLNCIYCTGPYISELEFPTPFLCSENYPDSFEYFFSYFQFFIYCRVGSKLVL